MPNFFDKQFNERVKEAIDRNDPKLLQILLSTKYCQLWEDWLTHSILSYKIIGITQTLKYQLPINIIAAQKQVLDKNFGRLINYVFFKIFYLCNSITLFNHVGNKNPFVVEIEFYVKQLLPQ